MNTSLRCCKLSKPNKIGGFFGENPKQKYKNKKCLIYSTCTTKFEMKHSTYHTTGTERRAGHMIQTKISSQ